jgi:hypothetical protein
VRSAARVSFPYCGITSARLTGATPSLDTPQTWGETPTDVRARLRRRATGAGSRTRLGATTDTSARPAPTPMRPTRGRPADAGDQANVRAWGCEGQTTLHTTCGQHRCLCAGHAQDVCTAWGQRWGRRTYACCIMPLTRGNGLPGRWRKTSSRAARRSGHSRFLSLTPLPRTATGPSNPHVFHRSTGDS